MSLNNAIILLLKDYDISTADFSSFDLIFLWCMLLLNELIQILPKECQINRRDNVLLGNQYLYCLLFDMSNS